MDSTELINLQRNSVADISIGTPVKPRLGKFIDVYSPEHLNLTPQTKEDYNFPEFNDDANNLLTPNNHQNISFRCRTVKPQHRQVGYSYYNCSFEGNQSFPCVSRRNRATKINMETPTKLKSTADSIRVDGPNGLRFNTSLAVSEVTGSPVPSQCNSQQAINISKAVFTIEPKSSKILIVNNKACSLLGYSSAELCGSKLSDLLRSASGRAFSFHEAEEGDAADEGPLVLLSGKVVELVCKDASCVEVSLWIRQLDNDGPCLVVAEPVSCKNVVFTVESETGTVLACDSEDAALLFQAESSDRLLGLPIATLIPAVQLPEKSSTATVKQKLTGRTLDGGCFPLWLWISKPKNSEAAKLYKDKNVLEVKIRVTYNVSGLLVVDDSGIVTACNPHFAKLTFGKAHSEVIGHHIEELVHNFCREADLLRAPDRNRDMTLSPLRNDGNGSASDTDEDSCAAFNGSQKSACTSLNVLPSLSHTQHSLSHTQQSSSALGLDKSTSLVTHTPTPTQDMVSSISTEQRIDVPDVTSAMSGISIEEDPYCQSSISKSRSENILRSEQKLQIKEKSESIYYTSQHSEELTPTGNTPKVRVNDNSVSQRLSFDSIKYKSLKVNVGDRSSLSLDFCDSNETSADFLTPINEMPVSGDMEDLPKMNGNESVDTLSNADLETQTESMPRKKFEDEPPETPCVVKRAMRSLLTTSTPARPRDEPRYKDGTYRGLIIHKDGTELNVVYTVSTVRSGGRGTTSGAGPGPGTALCVWLGVHCSRRASRASDTSMLTGNKSVSSRPQSMSLLSVGDEQTAGDYSNHYVTLKQIGKGAYGCVKMAYRRSDRLLCVAKFILKEKVSSTLWTDAPDGRRLPLELSLLLTLNHTNIVSVLEVFENEKYFQLVMEKHGAPLDLFEFIERRPRLDEPLASYIFRQVAAAVEYLHSLNILHRDIKDENIILDSRFHVKLIDFGSATFMTPDSLFSTFYGTTEYCSPEVLAGNKYRGPELEMWSMGITLYVLIFFMNPFSDIEDTIQGPLVFPHPVSDELSHLLRWMLEKQASARCNLAALLAHSWLRQPVTISQYNFAQVLGCAPEEVSGASVMYYSGSLSSPRTSSQLSLPEPLHKERGVGGGGVSAWPRAPEPVSDNCSLRSSADILDISSKPVSEAADVSSDATGHAAADIDYDIEHYDSWDECEQDSFS